MEEPREMKVTHKQMKDARLPLEYRDYCAHLLIPLNECRLATNGWPWKCQHERHAYERCEYNEHLLQKLRRYQQRDMDEKSKAAVSS